MDIAATTPVREVMVAAVDVRDGRPKLYADVCRRSRRWASS